MVLGSMGQPIRSPLDRSSPGCLLGLSTDEATDYTKVRDAMLYQLEILLKHYWQRFKTKKNMDKQRPHMLDQTLRLSIDK